MPKNIKFFLLGVGLSLVFCWGVNALNKYAEDVFYGLAMKKYPAVTAYLAPSKPEINQADSIRKIASELTASSIIVAEISKKEQDRPWIIFEKNSQTRRPIASLVKLMTAVVVEEFYPSDTKVKVSERAVQQMEVSGFLKPGAVLRKNDLLFIMLIESSNDAAFALAEALGLKPFVDLMNIKARAMGLSRTYFSNPMGLDPEDVSSDIFGTEPGLSSARDLLKLIEYIIREHPFLLDILNKKRHELYLEDGAPHHILENTNELLGIVPQVVAGKTGYTEKAGGCLLTISRARFEKQNYLITIVLESEDKFEETEKILKAYYK